MEWIKQAIYFEQQCVPPSEPSKCQTYRCSSICSQKGFWSKNGFPREKSERKSHFQSHPSRYSARPVCHSHHNPSHWAEATEAKLVLSCVVLLEEASQECTPVDTIPHRREEDIDGLAGLLHVRWIVIRGDYRRYNELGTLKPSDVIQVRCLLSVIGASGPFGLDERHGDITLHDW